MKKNIGNERFKTKKEFLERLRTLKNQPYGTIFFGNDLEFLKHAEHRYDPHGGIHGYGVYFSVGHDFRDCATTYQQCLNVKYQDGHCDVLSIHNVANSFHKPKCTDSWEKSYARESIIDQVQQFKYATENICNSCRKICNQYEIDHDYPTFSELFKNFKTQVGPYIINKEKWPVYHKNNCNLQKLCKDCHSKKTKLDVSNINCAQK
jgi:hypothetical protein